MRWAISTFEPYKAPGGDGIYPVLLQKGMRVLALSLCKLLRACLATGFVSRCWQEAKVVLIPKAGRALLGTVKDYTPISLTSFILKLMERLDDRYIREVPLVENPLRREQHAYQEGKSAATALAEAVTEIEKGIKCGFAPLFCSISRAPSTTPLWKASARVQESMMFPTQWKGGCGAC